jgi:hypothetical protein
VIKNKIVKQILETKTGLKEIDPIYESLENVAAYGAETYFLLKKILGKMTEEKSNIDVLMQPESKIDPNSLRQEAPSVRYSATPGFQLSRASTIA